MTIVAVGKNSFLAQSVREFSPADKWIWLSHDEAKHTPEILNNASCVINFAFSPELQKGDYDPQYDIDRIIAKQLSTNVHYIMLSTRMVYGAGRGKGFSEQDKPQPENTYGRNKAIIEENLKKSWPEEKLTILRLSNIFGYEPGRHTFFGIALKNLATKNAVTFNIDPSCMRDFLPAHIFADYVYKIACAPTGGIFNIGCGFGIQSGQVVSWIIEGYGRGELVVTDNSRKGEFFLSMEKTLSAYALKQASESDIREAAIACGKRLKSFNAG
ncbi:MAG: hypothetical protein DI626_04745 [Micavibrio aeruginosavorus]|uniref:NAD-dependent epimerase/dehydratase domain-containing protein n=1 Tax=Micavibrio aeruginosavorus TaxID=349221 RepID=A0A2W5A1J5_9BACT|nr:MAG: hypothetical protein DI626_04745 [Micavibrio aeruginosavorus]